MLHAAKKSFAQLAMLGGLAAVIMVALVVVTSLIGWLGYIVVLIPFYLLIGGR